MALSLLTARIPAPLGAALEIAGVHARGLELFSLFDQPANRAINFAPSTLGGTRTVANDGVFSGSLAPIIGPNGLHVVATNANYMSFANVGALTEATVMAAFYISTAFLTIGITDFIMGGHPTDSAAGAYDWGFYAAGGSTGKISYFPVKSADAPQIVTSIDAAAVDTLYVIAGSFKSGVTDGTNLFVNGVLQGTNTNTGSMGTAYPVRIGGQWGGSPGMTWKPMGVAVWKRQLPSSEIASISRDLDYAFRPQKRRMSVKAAAGGGGGGGSEGAAWHHWAQTMGAR